MTNPHHRLLAAACLATLLGGCLYGNAVGGAWQSTLVQETATGTIRVERAGRCDEQPYQSGTCTEQQVGGHREPNRDVAAGLEIAGLAASVFTAGMATVLWAALTAGD
jgi:hypothetical protein